MITALNNTHCLETIIIVLEIKSKIPTALKFWIRVIFFRVHKQIKNRVGTDNIALAKCQAKAKVVIPKFW